MRRYITLMSAFAVLVAALGCQHVGGKCDCGFAPSDYQLTGPTNPYPSAPVIKPVPVVPVVPVVPKGGNEE